MTKQQKSPPPNIPDIKRCPNCGNPVLIGDVYCSNCGQHVERIDQSIRKMDPKFIAGTGITMGIIVTLAAIEASSDMMQLLLVLVGIGLVLGGSTYMGISIVFLENRKRRK